MTQTPSAENRTEIEGHHTCFPIATMRNAATCMMSPIFQEHCRMLSPEFPFNHRRNPLVASLKQLRRRT